MRRTSQRTDIALLIMIYIVGDDPDSDHWELHALHTHTSVSLRHQLAITAYCLDKPTEINVDFTERQLLDSVAVC